MRIRQPTLVLAMVLATTVSAADGLDNQSLTWRASKVIPSAVVPGVPRPIDFVPFTDERHDPKLIAENREKRSPRRVTTSTDVGAFVSTQMRHLFDEAGFRTVDSGGTVTVSGQVMQFFVVETDRYRATVTLHLSLRAADGKPLWEGTVSGADSTFGRSYKMKNYDQVLSDALVNATSALLADPNARGALTMQ